MQLSKLIGEPYEILFGLRDGYCMSLKNTSLAPKNAALHRKYLLKMMVVYLDCAMPPRYNMAWLDVLRMCIPLLCAC